MTDAVTLTSEIPAAFTSITSGSSSTDATTYATVSVTLTAGRLYILSVENSHGTAATAVSAITGGSAGVPTFTERSTLPFNATLNRVTILTAVPSANYTGTLIANFGGTTQTGAAWSLVEVTGIATSTDDGYLQAQTATGTSGTASVSIGLASGSNSVFVAQAHAGATASAPGTGFTEIHDVTANTPAQALQTMYAYPGNSSPSATFTSVAWGFIAIELDADGALANSGWSIYNGTTSDVLIAEERVANFGTYSLVEFTTPGSGTWTVPADVSVIKAMVVVGGGGGGAMGWSVSSNDLQTTQYHWSGGGGAGGAFVRITNLTVTPGATLSYTVGSGGAGATTVNSLGSTGGTTSATVSSVTFSCTGGTGGVYYGTSGTSTGGTYTRTGSLPAGASESAASGTVTGGAGGRFGQYLRNSTTPIGKDGYPLSMFPYGSVGQAANGGVGVNTPMTTILPGYGFGGALGFSGGGGAGGGSAQGSDSCGSDGSYGAGGGGSNAKSSANLQAATCGAGGNGGVNSGGGGGGGGSGYFTSGTTGTVTNGIAGAGGSGYVAFIY